MILGSHWYTIPQVKVLIFAFEITFTVFLFLGLAPLYYLLRKFKKFIFVFWGNLGSNPRQEAHLTEFRNPIVVVWCVAAAFDLTMLNDAISGLMAFAAYIAARWGTATAIGHFPLLFLLQ